MWTYEINRCEPVSITHISQHRFRNRCTAYTGGLINHKGILPYTAKDYVAMKDVIESRQRGSCTQPATFTSADNRWEKEVLFSDGVLLLQSGIPAAHAKGVPDDATKNVVWKRKKGMHVISLFKNDGDGETWIVHVSNGGRDYVSDTFTDVSAAKKHITELRETGDF